MRTHPKTLLGAKGIATGSKDATRGSILSGQVSTVPVPSAGRAYFAHLWPFGSYWLVNLVKRLR